MKPCLHCLPASSITRCMSSDPILRVKPLYRFCLFVFLGDFRIFPLSLLNWNLIIFFLVCGSVNISCIGLLVGSLRNPCFLVLGKIFVLFCKWVSISSFWNFIIWNLVLLSCLPFFTLLFFISDFLPCFLGVFVIFNFNSFYWVFHFCPFLKFFFGSWMFFSIAFYFASSCTNSSLLQAIHVNICQVLFTLALLCPCCLLFFCSLVWPLPFIWSFPHVSRDCSHCHVSGTYLRLGFTEEWSGQTVWGTS